MEFSDFSLSVILGVSISAILLDIFFRTDIISVVSLLGISIYISSFFSVSWEWSTALCIMCWLVTTALYFLLSRKGIDLIQHAFDPKGKSVKEMTEDAVGEVAVYREIDGAQFAKWKDELWPVHRTEENNFSDGENITISSYENGVVSIEKTK